jgi:hypothetical protein
MSTSTTLRHYRIRATGEELILHSSGCWGEWRDKHAKAYLEQGNISLRGVCVNCGGSHAHPFVEVPPPEQLEMTYPDKDPDGRRRVRAQFHSLSQLQTIAEAYELIDWTLMSKAELIEHLLAIIPKEEA